MAKPRFTLRQSNSSVHGIVAILHRRKMAQKDNMAHPYLQVAGPRFEHRRLSVPRAHVFS